MPAPRNYPRVCTACGSRSVEFTKIDKAMEVKHDGAMHSIAVHGMPVERCTSCGSTTLGIDSDDAINDALRQHLRLLSPQQIRDFRTALGLTQVELADQIKCAAESISRWENGVVIQSRAYDRLMRAYFQVPEVRELFASLELGAFYASLSQSMARTFVCLEEQAAMADRTMRSLRELQSYGRVDLDDSRKFSAADWGAVMLSTTGLVPHHQPQVTAA